jgi:hypothetical protein
MRLNNARADLSARINLNNTSDKELETVNQKIVTLTKEVAELSKKVKGSKNKSS